MISIYQKLGSDFGSRLSTRELKRRIAAARKKYFHVRAASELSASELSANSPELNQPDLISSDEIELELWRQLVVDVFKEIPESNLLFAQLWEHFRLPENWKIYDDAGACWSSLRKDGCLIGLASNFDSRLLQLAQSFPLLKSADFIFQSAGVGFRKPSAQFYRTIEKELRDTITDTDADNHADNLKIYMVGDDLRNDCLAPQGAGWSGFWLNRSQDPISQIKIESNELKQVATLTEFAQRILRAG